MAGRWGLGGLRTWGGTYSPQYIATGLPTDEEITEMVYDAIDGDPLIPYDADIDVEVDAGAVTLSGAVPNKDMKHAAGDDVWWVPGVTDVENNLMVTGRRRAKGAPREVEGAPAKPTGRTRRGG
ncbi:MAG: BON domain-containing protein [Chloroflexi bacterium]|nr:BON domain-containing protein [Chloroflexota bacterium]